MERHEIAIFDTGGQNGCRKICDNHFADREMGYGRDTVGSVDFFDKIDNGKIVMNDVDNSERSCIMAPTCTWGVRVVVSILETTTLSHPPRQLLRDERGYRRKPGPEQSNWRKCCYEQ